MTNAEHNAHIYQTIDALKAIRAQYDTTARHDGIDRMYADNAREQSARVTGEIARLRATIRN